MKQRSFTRQRIVILKIWHLNFRKLLLSFVMSVSLSVRLSAWNKSLPIGSIFMKFDIVGHFQSLSTQFVFH